MNASQDKFGQLKSVNLRDDGCWPTEAGDFTPWLADAASIELLGRTIGLDLQAKRLD